MLTAREAKKKALENSDITRNILLVMEAITAAIKLGKMSIEYDDTGYDAGNDKGLTKKEILYFLKLGYKIEKGEWETWEGSHGREHRHYKPTKISWK